MTVSVVDLTRGPGKDDLLRAAQQPGLSTIFDTPSGAIEATIDKIEEQGADALAFTLWGRLASTDLRGAYFTANYDCQSRTGRLALKTA
jgi:hypothetical protein